MILILSALEDKDTATVVKILQRRKTPFTQFDPGIFPAATLSITYSATGPDITIRSPEILRLKDVTAVWRRRPTRPKITSIDTSLRKYLSAEWQTVLAEMWSTLKCFWLPSQPAIERRANGKSLQLQVAMQLGFEIPPTLITSNAEDLENFFLQHNGKIISKLPSAAFNDEMLNTFVRYTEPVTSRDLTYSDALQQCPMIFQAYVSKHVELRITVVGNRAFAAEIQSQTTNHTRIDWRRYQGDETPYAIHDLPVRVAQKCTALVAELGLHYGAIDMILTPDGRYIFLEINPNGQFGWIEHLTGLPISEAICDLLTVPPRENPCNQA